MVRDDSYDSSPGPSVVLAHRHPLLRDGIACILRQTGFRVVGQAGTVQAVQKTVAEERPDIILLDWELPDGSVEALRALIKTAPSAIVVILTRPQPSWVFKAAVEAGVSGYLSVDVSPQEFVQALHMLSKGDVVVSRGMAESFKDTLTPITSRMAQDLTARQVEVLALMVEGATNKEIARHLVVTESTAKAHVRHILHKLELHNRQQAVAYAIRNGLVP